MRLCRFGEGRLGLVEGAIRPRRHGRARRAAVGAVSVSASTTCLIANLDAVRARASQLAASAPVAAAGRPDAAQPGGQPGQDRRGAGELPEAPDRGARPTRRCTTTTRATRSPSTTAGLFLKATSSLVGRGPGRGDPHAPSAAPITRWSWRSSSAETASRVPRENALRLRGRLRHRPRHLDPRLRGPQLPQVGRQLQRAGAVARDRRRDSEPGRARSARSRSTANAASSRTRGT